METKKKNAIRQMKSKKRGKKGWRKRVGKEITLESRRRGGNYE